MRSIVELFTTTTGRIGRGRFWIGLLIIAVATMVVSAILMQLGLGETTTTTGTIQVDGGATQTFSTTRYTLNGWAGLIVSLLGTVPWTIIAIKRRHDRNSAGWDAVAFSAAWVLLSLLQAVRLFPNGVGVPMFAVGLWGVILFVFLGFIKGTPGANSYGPDPLAPLAAPVPAAIGTKD